MGRLFRSKRKQSSAAEGPAEARRRAAPADPAGAEPGGELDARLKRLDWPAPDPKVRERCLEQILARVEAGEIPSADSR